MINFSNLEYFLMVAEELSFSSAAQKLYISQQSLSAHIARMEKELGFVLFERTKPLTLTPKGHHFRLRAKEMLLLRTQTLQELSDSIIRGSEKLSLGISYAYSSLLLPLIMPTFVKRYPNIRITLVERNAQDLDSELDENHIDLLLGRLPFFASDIATIPILKDQMMIMIPETILDIAFGSQKELFRRRFHENPNLQFLKNVPFLLTRRGRVRSLSDDIFHSYGLTPKIIIETETIRTAVMLSRCGTGALISPHLFLQDNIQYTSGTESLSPNIFALPQLQPFCTIAFAYSKKRLITDTMQAFIDTTLEVLKESGSAPVISQS